MAEEEPGNIPAVEEEEKPEVPKEVQESNEPQESVKSPEVIDVQESVDVDESPGITHSHIDNSIDQNILPDSQRDVTDNADLEEKKEEEDQELEDRLEAEADGYIEPHSAAPAEKFFVPTNPCIE